MNIETIIVGAGAAGLFATSELYKLGYKDMLVLEIGNRLDRRVCPNPNSCVSCEKCNVLYGVGGAGMFSDGKLNFSPRIGGNINSILSEKTYKTYNNYLIDQYKFNFEEPNRVQYNRVMQKYFSNIPARFELIEQAHLGSDNLPNFIRKVSRNIVQKIKTNVRILNIDVENEKYIIRTQKETYVCKNLIIATGQAGANFALKIAKQYGVNVKANHADIGIRVELKSKLWDELIQVEYDPKIYFNTKHGNVRTFCTNPSGYIIMENKNNMLTCNGHAMKNTKSNNTNFALMYKANVNYPREYINCLCKSINKNNDGKLMLQLAEDFVNTEVSKSIGKMTPTCKNYKLGNIALYYPKLIYSALSETLQYIQQIVPEFFNEQSLVYAPEVKLYTDSIELINEGFESQIKNMFFIGDCCGHIHGLTNAMISGIACANYIVTR